MKIFSMNSNHWSFNWTQPDRIAGNQRLWRAGWRLKEIKRLATTLQSALRRFEKATDRRQLFRVDFLFENPVLEDAFFAIDKEKNVIEVYLRTGPKNVLGKIPWFFAQELADLCLEICQQPFPPSGVRFSLLEDRYLMEQGIKSIRYFYLEERKAPLNEEGLREIFLKLAEHYGMDIIKRKLCYHFLEPHISARSDVEIMVNSVVADFIAKVIPFIVDPDEVPLWSMIAFMAMQATLAKRYGHAMGYLKCQGVLGGKVGKGMASIEFLQMPERELDYFRQYPIETERQLKLAPAGYNVVFNAFQMVFEHYFARVWVAAR